MTLLKKMYNAKIKNIEDKIGDITTSTALNAKINEVKNKIPDITNLATTTALTAVENKIHNVSNLFNRTDNETKIENNKSDHDHDKYITTQQNISLKDYHKQK